MIRIKDIQEALANLVGWEQSYDPERQIEETLTQSESGLTYQCAHPLVTLDNIESIMPDTYGLRYKKWERETEYRAGDKVKDEDEVYIAIADNVGEKPSEDESGDYWKQYNFTSDYLRNLTKEGIATMVQTFLQMKQLTHETKNLLERRVFFDGAGRLNNTLENRSKIVGIEIVPVRAMGVTAKVEKIGLQMTGATGKIRLYLFHSSQINPIKYQDVNFTKTNGGFQWFELDDWYLPYISDENNAGGAWYVCYNQDELPAGMQAINFTKDWNREPCGTCNPGNLAAWRELTNYLLLSPFYTYAPATFEQYPELWNVDDNIYTNTMNYGMNAEVTVGCDLTDFIIEQRAMFATALQKQVAVSALRKLALNPNVRVNRNQSNASRMEILYELDGNTQGRESGLGYELKKAYEALSIDTAKIDRICLRCNNKGVRYSHV